MHVMHRMHLMHVMHAPRPIIPEGSLRVSLFAGMALAVDHRSVDLTWSGGTAAALRSRLATEFPAAAALLARSAVAVGNAYVADDAPVPGGADVAIIPPVSGG